MIVFNKMKKNMGLLKQTLVEFDNDNALKLSAALSYYTNFSISSHGSPWVISFWPGAFQWRPECRGKGQNYFFPITEKPRLGDKCAPFPKNPREEWIWLNTFHFKKGGKRSLFWEGRVYQG